MTDGSAPPPSTASSPADHVTPLWLNTFTSGGVAESIPAFPPGNMYRFKVYMLLGERNPTGVRGSWVPVFTPEDYGNSRTLVGELFHKIEGQRNEYALLRTLLSLLLSGWTRAIDVRLHAIRVRPWAKERCAGLGKFQEGDDDDVCILDLSRLQSSHELCEGLLRGNWVIDAFWIPVVSGAAGSFHPTISGEDMYHDLCAADEVFGWHNFQASTQYRGEGYPDEPFMDDTTRNDTAMMASGGKSVDELEKQLGCRNMWMTPILDLPGSPYEERHQYVLSREAPGQDLDGEMADSSQNAVVLTCALWELFRSGHIAFLPLPNAGWIDRNTIRAPDDLWIGQPLADGRSLPMASDLLTVYIRITIDFDRLNTKDFELIPTLSGLGACEDAEWRSRGPRGAFFGYVAVIRLLGNQQILSPEILDWLCGVEKLRLGDDGPSESDRLDEIRKWIKDVDEATSDGEVDNIEKLLGEVCLSSVEQPESPIDDAFSDSSFPDRSPSPSASSSYS